MASALAIAEVERLTKKKKKNTSTTLVKLQPRQKTSLYYLGSSATEAKSLAKKKKRNNLYCLSCIWIEAKAYTFFPRFSTKTKNLSLFVSPTYISITEPLRINKNNRYRFPLLHWYVYQNSFGFLKLVSQTNCWVS